MYLSKGSNKRMVELDSLRGLAALAVFFSHVINMTLMDFPFAGAIKNSVLHFFWDGAAAVVLFFVLSGFVLSLPYVGEGGKKIDVVPFLIRRVFRIYPAYITTLGIALLLKFYVFKTGGLNGLSPWIIGFWNWETSSLTLMDIIKHIIMIGPSYEMGQIDPIIWSLVIEMKISLIFPFIIPIIKRIKNLPVAGCVIILSAIFAKGFQSSLLAYLPLFILGGCLAHFRLELIEWLKKIPAPVQLAMAAVSIVLYTGRFSLSFMPLGDAKQNYMIGAGVAIIILFSISMPALARFLLIKPVRFLGDISYSFYLVHFPVLLACTSMIFPQNQSVLMSSFASLLVSILLSYINFRLTEKPFQRIGRNVSNRADELIQSIKKKMSIGETPDITG